MKLFPAVLTLLATLAACASTPPAPAGPNLYVMRHLQKDTGSDPGLSSEGRASAERLAAWFAKDPPRAIFVSATRRARETAAVLAAKVGVTVQEYSPGDIPGVVARAKAETGTVLIVGHSNTVPEIVAALGGTKPAPIAEDMFGQIWHLRGVPPVVEVRSLGSGG